MDQVNIVGFFAMLSELSNSLKTNNLGTTQGEEVVDAESAEQLLEAIHIEADHDLVIDHNGRSGLAVQAYQLLQGLRVGGHILVFKGDLA